MFRRLAPTGRPQSRHSGSPPGMTLIEILIVLCISSIFLGAVYSFSVSHHRVYQRQYLGQERDQSLRFAMNTLVQELFGAGYHAAGDALLANLPDWVPPGFIASAPLPIHMDANPKITLGRGGEPDMITFLSVLPGDTCLLDQEAPVSATRITLRLSRTETRRQFKPGDLICIGHETVFASVVGVSGNSLLIDTDPTEMGHQPMPVRCPAGMPVGEISVVTYAVFNRINDPRYRRHTAGHPVLKQKVNDTGFQPVVENIPDMQLSLEDDGRIKIFLAATYDSPVAGNDGEITATAHVRCRNLSGGGVGLGCDLPSRPANLTVHAALNDSYPCQIFMSWDPVATDATGEDFDRAVCEVTGYRIYFDIASKTYGHHVDVAADMATGYTLAVSALPSDAYYVSVAALNGAGAGEKSGEITVRDLLAPPAPVGLAAAYITGGGVSLSWQESMACDVAGYHVYRRVGAATGYERISGHPVAVGNTRYLDAQPPPGSTCRYTVRAEDHGFNLSPHSDRVSVVIPGTPDQEESP